MQRILILLLFSFILPQELLSQILPKEGCTLNYRRIGVSFPAVGDIIKYKIEIASGECNKETFFKKNIISSAYSKTNTAIIDVPSFGQKYTWRVVYTHKNAQQSKSAFHHFSTGYVPEIDTTKNRLRIIKSTIKYNDNFVFVDGINVLYDMKGNPVWYLPYKEKTEWDIPQARDLKISPQGTLTFLTDRYAYEMNYNDDTLWQGPAIDAVSGADSEQYHHEFTRLSNGHYMVLGAEHVLWDHKIIPADTGFSIAIVNGRGKSNNNSSSITKKTPFGSIIEYDEKGNIVWSWKSSNYFMNSDVVYYMPPGKMETIDVHENSFFFDEQDSIIYISFRNISRILKIKYPQGNVINTYGEIFKPGIAPAFNKLFSYQHAVKRSKDGYIYLFNNNVWMDTLMRPKVIVMRESPEGKDSLSKIWEYECTISDINMSQFYRRTWEMQQQSKSKLAIHIPDKSLFLVTTGGNVIELPDHSIFVCMNSQYSKLFIVNHDKKILWSGTPERLNLYEKTWYLNPNLYRANIVTRKELDHLIYNSMKPHINSASPQN